MSKTLPVAPDPSGALERKVDEGILVHARRLFPEVQRISDSTADRLQAILETALGDKGIQGIFPPKSIRHTAMCGEVSRELLKLFGDSPDLISLLSVGDTDFPDFIKPIMHRMLDRAHKHYMDLLESEGPGYDLNAQGTHAAREALIGYFGKHYGFSDELQEAFAKNSAITLGGMSALDHIISGMITEGHKEGKRPMFFAPDNSFKTFFQIFNQRSYNGRVAQRVVLTTSQKNALHLTPAEVDQYYSCYPNRNDYFDVWYITPVGNPSGTKTTPDSLYETCAAILKHNPDAVIVLDCVYARTLPDGDAKNLLSKVLGNDDMLDRIVFVESFSKTHAICGLRVGDYFSKNRKLFNAAQTVNMTVTAGPGLEKSALAMTLAEAIDEEEVAIRQLHEFWSNEKKGLYNYLVKQERFPGLFEDDQSHMHEDHFDDPLGLYVFIKLKPGVTDVDVLMKTRCLGVVFNMGSGNYIRFSVGKITKPTYAQYC